MVDMSSLHLEVATDGEHLEVLHASLERMELLGVESEPRILQVASHGAQQCERARKGNLPSDLDPYIDWPCASRATDHQVMSPVAFARDPETHACCWTDDGGIPLDLTLKAFLTRPHGVFIESGAYDGVLQSNTLIFERKFGWTGILVEPQALHGSPLRAALRANRPRSFIVNAALTNSSWEGVALTTATAHDGKHRLESYVDLHGAADNMSGVALPAKGVTLSRLLDVLHVEQVDLWSLDVEGFELMAVQGVDFRRHRPRFILIEAWKDTLEELQDLLRDAGYAQVRGHDPQGGFSGWSRASINRDYLWLDALRDDNNEFENLDAWLAEACRDGKPGACI